MIAATILALALSGGHARAEELGPAQDPSLLPMQEAAPEPDAKTSPPVTQERAAPAARVGVAKPKDKPGCISGPTLAIDPETAPIHLGTQTYPQTLNLCDHHLVLTFDDGPSAETTPLVLKALRDAGVRANFFLIGRHACRHPDLAREEVDEGHVVGHHSNTHPSFTLRGFDQRSAERDIQNGIAADEAAIYGAGAGSTGPEPLRPRVPFFRFPGFADTKPLLAYLDRRGIAVFGSDLWAGDWIAMTPEHERQRILDLLERRPHHNGIILLHDTRMSTARMLPDLLRDLTHRGYRFVQIVYRRNAPAPSRVDGTDSVPLTERIISRLHTPIVPGRQTLDPYSGPGCTAEPAVSGEEAQP